MSDLFNLFHSVNQLNNAQQERNTNQSLCTCPECLEKWTKDLKPDRVRERVRQIREMIRRKS